MSTKRILGLDLGTNSIGWAVINANETASGLQPIGIEKAGSRIIPMDAAQQGDFERGNTISDTADRTKARGMRRLNQRRALRRERMNRVLRILGWLPAHYAEHLNRFGQLNKGTEPKLAWNDSDGKNTFLFQTSFEEMCAEFKQAHPELLSNGKKIAYDWTIYYLRKKALSQKISGQELAWILLQANQKRGYNQARGEEEESNPLERKEYMSLKVVDVKQTGEKSKGKDVYEVTFENGWVRPWLSAYPLTDWVGKTKELIVTTKLNADGTEAVDKEGDVKRSFRAPDENDWTLKKVKTQHDITKSGKTIGEYIYDALLNNPDEKIIGQLVRTVDRSLYHDELMAIVRKQMEFHAELQDRETYLECIEALYAQNEAYRNSIAERGFAYLLVDDILFYQRPLKSKKSLISDCPHEYKHKCLSKSHPLYEEFRVLQFVQNLTIIPEVVYDKDEIKEWLMSQKEVDQKHLLDHVLGKKHTGYRWNYVEDKTYPMAPTTSLLSNMLAKYGATETKGEILHLWHILYSVTNQRELNQALVRYEQEHGLSEGFAAKLSKTKPFDSQYGAYSHKATVKLLSLMRSGKEWSWDAIDAKTQARIDKLLTGEFDENISDRIREKCLTMDSREQFQGLPLWFAEYVVYDLKDTEKWETPEDIDKYLSQFRLHSLNNPIVEKVVMESLRVVRDIWREQGTIDEIHLELAREMKKTAEQRRKDQERQMQNEAANLRAKQMLMEMMNPDMDVDGVRGYSPSQLELYRIYESDVLSVNKAPEDIQKTIDALATLNKPSHADIRKYRLWLDQKYRSPYTGELIPLSRLFTPEYEIEHVIPQSRFFDDSMSNKVICESEVNKLKDRELAHEFITNHGGERVTLSGGRVVEVLRKENYESIVKETFGTNKAKLEKLMLDEIPEKFVNRQLNDSRYISRMMKSLLSNIVRTIDPKTHKYEAEETSRNLIVCNGSVTDRLKKDWGVNDVWNHIILPRFQRLNQILGTTVYTQQTANGHLIPNMPIEIDPTFKKKRIDHRHHAMDAIVIACTTRNHVNLLNNESALPKDADMRYALNAKLREHGLFIKPWDTFTQDVEQALNEIIVSHKQNLRVINKSNNHYMRYKDGKKQIVKQEKGENWAIRKSLHKETGFGLVNLRFKKKVNLKYALTHIDDIVERDLRLKLRELLSQGWDEKKIKKYFDTEHDTWSDINLNKIEVYFYTNDTNDRYYATRVSIDESFDEDTIQNKITDGGIQKILTAWLRTCDNDPKIAFSADGLEKMNANIRMLNGGVAHKPIYKVRKYEKAEKFAVGESGAKAKKYVEAAKGTNLFFAIFVSQRQNAEIRSYLSIPLRVAMVCQKQDCKSWKSLFEQWAIKESLVEPDSKLRYILSPGDTVYLPTDEELSNGTLGCHKERLYKVVSFSGNQCFFIQSTVASVIHNKKEFSPLNKMERAISGEMIKETCVPIKIDRLGNIIE